MKADYYIPPGLSRGGSGDNNSYDLLLRNFPSSSFVTFNYDSLLEQLLLKLGRWRPEDGYGVPVTAQLTPGLVEPPKLPDRSSALVLHVHGTFCIYPSEYYLRADPDPHVITRWITPRDKPMFIFDPDSITHRFFPYERMLPTTGYVYPEERVVAPVPKKAEGLRATFLRAVYNIASELLAKAPIVVAIGYSFNPHDADSYEELLTQAQSRPRCIFLLVDPDAERMAASLSELYAGIEWRAFPFTFEQWVARGFPGLA